MTVTAIVEDYDFDYLDFNDRLSYLTCRTRWREVYARLSKNIRAGKRAHRGNQSSRDKIIHQYCLEKNLLHAGDLWNWDNRKLWPEVEALIKARPTESDRYYYYSDDATRMLETRKAMKEESARQREEARMASLAA